VEKEIEIETEEPPGEEAALIAKAIQEVEAIPGTEETKNKEKEVILLLPTPNHLQKAKALPVLNLRSLLKAKAAKGLRADQKSMIIKIRFQKKKIERLILT